MVAIVARVFDELEKARLCVNAVLFCGFGREDISFLQCFRNSHEEYLENGLHPLLSEYEELGRAVMVQVEDMGSLLAYGTIRASLPRNDFFTPQQLQETLMTLGLTEEESAHGRERLRQGNALLLVRVPDHWEEPLEELLDQNRACPLILSSSVGQAWQGSASPASSLLRSDTGLPEPTLPQVHKLRNRRHPCEKDFRSHFYLMHFDSNQRYEQCAEAYRYGYALGKSQQYANKPWQAVKPLLQKEWEITHDGPWEEKQDMVAYGFMKWRQHYQPDMLRRKRQNAQNRDILFPLSEQ